MASVAAVEPAPTSDGLDAIPPTESEPLLGGPGDAIQKPNAPMINNLWLGTGWIAQIGNVLLLVVIWAGVFTHPTMKLVSPHPLLQSLGVFTLSQAILLLQPTDQPETKLLGQRGHAVLQLLSFLLFAAGISVIETNKVVSHGAHLHSAHGWLGAVTAALLLAQYVFGLLMWAFPAVLGGVDAAKALWKYHRYTGYTLFLLVLATVAAAAATPYNEGILKIKLWSILLAVALILVGTFPRIQLKKLGIQRHHTQ
ncbi:eukaryotic cytochrome b561-domain-containing protein [Lasiosphaeria miniovina]|uniref:Eukaryotic cytochrome b561-domain-containing protein n=1 Tax=Lasiosphaeria miniovina TaxID=1954250 RepID=A0AA40DMY9_9PEZI|nr:eukaryotic cytochrome b561-domain-containing protein [Lasiosphaeria miniovina]KAK0706777.1 eukaryotic cytochrome b561-domain-containing protein [Lasiosphaeria miniovina]